ncbi:acyl-CoA thioesterase [Altererythrobacter endophyticus]|uniref:Acyl-CoA thioesterase n=2 Tax=Altericroceibacterium endophyticum TaxID=1808508 RepID=A0A6I4T909_9SPHN|nr:acyl-CoA thioesterase [Altericroceibacterium endophyticum]
MVFPGDTNHHGTLFGGIALAHMDKVAFLAATRHGRAPFVTAASQKIDFTAAAYAGEMIEATSTLVRVGRSSVEVEVELLAEALISGERRLCTRGRFTLVAVKGPDTTLPLPAIEDSHRPPQDGKLRTVDMVFPPQTNHYGTLYGGDALKMMGKAAFIAATRHSREIFVMAASDEIAFKSPIREGQMVELVSAIIHQGNGSLVVSVEMWGEDLLTGERCHAATANFTMAAVDAQGNAKPIG